MLYQKREIATHARFIVCLGGGGVRWRRYFGQAEQSPSPLCVSVCVVFDIYGLLQNTEQYSGMDIQYYP